MSIFTGLASAGLSRTLAISFCLFLAMGCNTKPPPAPQGAPGNRPAEETLESITEPLGKAADFEACRTAIGQLNLYLARNADEGPRPLDEKEREWLASVAGLDGDELAEVASMTLTPLDAHHLEICFLLRDAVRSLKLHESSSLDKAAEAFAWVIRQIRCHERKGEALSPLFVLRRGTGTAQERALVFLALLDQLGIDGCMIALPEKNEEKSSYRYWVAGALVDKAIYLFDLRLGLPLPGPGGSGIATLAQVRARPEILSGLTVDPKFPYDVTLDHCKQAQVHVAYTLSSLSPRMRYLQGILATHEKVELGIDPRARLHGFQAACKDLPEGGCPVRVWNQPGDNDSPLRVLRHCLPREEGGVDTQTRQQQAMQQLIPWQYLPRQFAGLPPIIGQELQPLFSVPFVSFVLDKHGPRSLVLQGRYEEATNRLVENLRELRSQQELLRSQKNLDDEIREWRTKAVRTYAGYLQATEQANNPKAAGQAGAAIAQAKERVAALWKEGAKIRFLAQASGAEPLSGEVIYLQALCKMEQAERLQARRDRALRAGKDLPAADLQALRSAWKEDRGWWATYLEEQAASPSAPAARFHQARALFALGERDSARALLGNLNGELTALEKTVRLFLAKQWQGAGNSPP